MPIRARLPIVMQEEVIGRVFLMPPILRMSCSFERLWMIEPEHRNSIALKKAWVEMWKNASWGWFRPIVTIMRPSWLEVEKAIIFLMSFWVMAQMAVNRVVRAPRHKDVVRTGCEFSRIGCIRISRKIPATTIVLE